MRILTYTWDRGTAPDWCASIARFIIPKPATCGKGLEEFHPVVIYGKDTADAKTKAQAWWDAEIAKVRAQEAGYAKQAADRATKKAVKVTAKAA